MLLDIWNFVTIPLIIIVTLAGFMISGCKNNGKNKKENDPKVKNARNNEISLKSRNEKVQSVNKENKNDEIKKDGKPGDEKKEQFSKIENLSKDDKRLTESEKKENINESTQKFQRKNESGSSDDHKESSIKEKTNKIDENNEVSLKENSKKENSIKEASRKMDEKYESSVKECSQRSDIKKDQSDDNNNDSVRAVPEINEVQPNKDKIVFDLEQIKADIELENKTNVRRAIKIKCSDNKTYRVNPVFKYIEPGKTINIEIIRSGLPVKVDKLVILNTPATLDGNEPHNEFKKTEKYSSCVIPLTVVN